MADEIELLCKKIFNNYLDEKQISVKQWRDLSKENLDPPDYTVIVNNKTYAVEVTQFEVKYESASGEEINDLTYIYSMKKFVRKVCIEAKDLNILNGTYVVTFFNPISNFSKKSNDIKEQFLKYIENTKNESKSNSLILKENNFKICKIAKAHNKSNKIEPGFIYPCKWLNSPKHLNEITSMLKNVLLTKKKKLKKQCINEPKILLIYNSYPLGNKRIYQQLVNREEIKEIINYFYSIFIIESCEEDEGYFIYSENSNW
ncbi:hypothetical protein [Sporohalobacter salinus]|uniref:hypothetical protein n=1 Tax=Sporohalobacter salinus TaxID=1494606 RepID=UPI00195FF1E1|nr:hypothetical protein [Sporohalobacter salinus]MBM7623699.1 hypothetical protein [Sporohalobacter salinus]